VPEVTGPKDPYGSDESGDDSSHDSINIIYKSNHLIPPEGFVDRPVARRMLFLDHLWAQSTSGSVDKSLTYGRLAIHDQ